MGYLSVRRLLPVAIGPVLALSLAAASAPPRPDFETRRIYPAGHGPVFVTVGDIDEDQIPDAVIADAQDDTIRVVFSNGVLDFDNPVLAHLGVQPASVVVVDLNRDGHPDLAVASDSPGGLAIALSAGNVTFQATQLFDAGGRCDSIVSADFNQDGKPDVALTNPLANSITWRAGNGAGGFGAPLTLSPGPAPEGIATADFNLDGHADLATTLGTGEVAVLLGDGTGGFGSPRVFPAGAGAEGIVAADLDGDGRTDLAVANRIDRSVTVLHGLGDGSFVAAATISLAYEAAAVAAADLDEDGRPDLLVSGDPVSGTILVLRGLGSGGYGAPTAFPSGAWPRSLAVADFNRDGHQDAVVVNTNGDDVALLFGNGSGRLRSEIRLPLIWSAVTDLDAADFNEDGFPDLVATNVAPIAFPACGTPQPIPGGGGPLDCGFESGLMRLTMLLGIGGGRFSTPLSFFTHCMPIASVAGDFNGDGHADVVVVNQGHRDALGVCVPASLSFFAGLGRGMLSAPRDLVVSDTPISAAAGDFDEDGHQDVAVGFEEGGAVRIYRVDGQGNLIAVSSLATPSPLRSMVAADLDGDGDQDLAGSQPDIDKVIVLRGDGAGHLAVQASCGSGRPDPRQIAAGDFTGDGRLDLAVATAGRGTPESSVTILQQSTSSQFCLSGNTSTKEVGLRPVGLAAADFNRDGVDEFVASDGAARMASPRSSSSSIAGPFDTFGVKGVGKLISRDLDGNGTPDLAAISDPGALAVVLNATPVAPLLQLHVEGDFVSWSGVAGATGYDVVRGDLAALRAGNGDYGAAALACVANDTPQTSVQIDQPPAPGGGLWIVARPVTPAGPGTYDDGGAGQVGSRDPSLRSAPLACP